ncbi:MAG: hypothetical protein PHO26_05035 [Dehalococcoidia bacterium]|nr:hypothetical protein [Dehalococcoidia bacterium]MDD5494449.1 hypothetical protein [Dehalococcoidia bacterium]
MSEKRMLILDAETVEKIEENRGDMSVSEFIHFIIDSHLEQSVQQQHNDGVTREEFHQFEEGIRDLLRSFLEFFLSYGLELGKQPTDGELDKLSLKLQGLSKSYKAKKY